MKRTCKQEGTSSTDPKGKDDSGKGSQSLKTTTEDFKILSRPRYMSRTLTELLFRSSRGVYPTLAGAGLPSPGFGSEATPVTEVERGGQPCDGNYLIVITQYLNSQVSRFRRICSLYLLGPIGTIS